MTIIDPYQLLGVTTKSTSNEVKKAYYNLALIMHPDKGGNKNEMILLEKSYRWIIEKVKYAEKVNWKDYEIVQGEFDEFIKTQNYERPQNFRDIIAETFNFTFEDFNQKYFKAHARNKSEKEEQITPSTYNSAIMYDFILSSLYQKFNASGIFNDETEQYEFIIKEIEKYCIGSINDSLLNIYNSSVPDGYGNLMLEPMHINQNNDKNGSSSKSNCIPFERSEVIIYEAPEHANNEMGEAYFPVLTMEDYTKYTPSLQMTDYKKAFEDNSKIKEKEDMIALEKNIELMTNIDILAKYEEENKKRNYQ